MAPLLQDGGNAVVVERAAERGFPFVDLGAEVFAELRDDVFLLRLRQQEFNCV
jgi:hypothetical protein